MKMFHFLIFGVCFITLLACDDSDNPSDVTSKPNENQVYKLSGSIDLTVLNKLLEKHDLPKDDSILEIGLYNLQGEKVETTKANGNSFDFGEQGEKAYLLKATTENNHILWACTEKLKEDTDVTISVDSTMEAALIYASMENIPADDDMEELKFKVESILPGSISIFDIKPFSVPSSSLPNDSYYEISNDTSDGQVTNEELIPQNDRLVQAVRRILEAALLKAIDYDPNNETVLWRLRAFAAGLHPIRALDSILAEPYNQYIPYIYSRRVLSSFLPSNILISDIQSDRWDYRIKGARGHDGGPHVINGGTTLLFDSDRHRETSGYKTVAIYKIALDAPDDAEPTILTDPVYSSQDPMFSWDEKKIAFWSKKSGTWNIWVMDEDGKNMTQLTHDDNPEIFNGLPRWSPDNKKIVFISDREGDLDIFIMNADGSDVVNITEDDNGKDDSFPVFSPDGRQIAFHSFRSGNGPEIYIMDVDGSNVIQLTDNKYFDEYPYWTHYGIDLVYTSGAAYENKKRTLRGVCTITKKKIAEMGDFSAAFEYSQPIWAATDVVLMVSQSVPDFDMSDDLHTTGDSAQARNSTKPNVGTAYSVNKVNNTAQINSYVSKVLRDVNQQPMPYAPVVW